jgi:hypothetical protein
MQSLANDAIEYSRRNPSIDPLLQKFELKPVSAGQPAAGQPATRPAR